MKYFNENILSLILAPLIIFISVVSYYRFFIKQDYTVVFEGICDPFTEECFVRCEDDSCNEKYFYNKTSKYASDLYNECGNDITECELANMCLPQDKKCLITYCNEDTVDIGEECEQLIKEDIPLNNLELNINI